MKSEKKFCSLEHLDSSVVAVRKDREVVTNCDQLMNRIFAIRGVQVMLDSDLAELYQVPTMVFNQSVKRNVERFPLEFRFQLTKDEFDSLTSQFVISKNHGRGGRRHLPFVFTEQGVAMLSGVLRSKVAVQTSIGVMKAFVAMRRFYFDHAGLVQRVGAIELKQLETDKRIDTVFDALDRGNLLPNGILPAGSECDSLRYVSRLVESAKSEIVIIDPYSDAMTLDVLAKKRPGVTVRLVCKDRGQPTSTEIAKFNRQYQGLTVTNSDDFHDRFVLIDNAELHNLGSSINSLGRRLTTYTTRDAKEIGEILAQLP